MRDVVTQRLRIAAIAFFVFSVFSCSVARYMDPTRSHPSAINLKSYGDTLRLPVALGERTCQEVLIAESTDGLWDGILYLDFEAQPIGPYPNPDSVGLNSGALEVTLDPPGARWGAQIPAGLGMEEAFTTMCLVVPKNLAAGDTVVRGVLRGSISFPDRTGVSGFVNRSTTIQAPTELRFVSPESLASYRAETEKARSAGVSASSLWGGAWLVNVIIALVCWGVYVNRRDSVTRT